LAHRLLEEAQRRRGREDSPFLRSVLIEQLQRLSKQAPDLDIALAGTWASPCAG
jgi:hypothetical protein